ncbi:FxsB family cyclophane-forming radical SAM/SPASM peptide maturase [Micromonospora sp. NPDC049679]|uniref:FxsB family cyclophane-forming radical SAM/SPASM peptide maturase n=1 Tax=Micromonospora sp. NPDC049679 TaxID=3155920 RepID=UPI0033E6A9F0
MRLPIARLTESHQHRDRNAPGAVVAAPFRQVLLKIHSRCNLACSYCYVYNHADQSWRGRPRAMPAETVDTVASRIAEHARTHRLPSVRVIMHGGEPLLAGAPLIEHAATAIRTALAPHTTVDLRLTTNGIMLNEDFLALFRRHGIRVGVSVDGGEAAHDRERRYANGQGSYRQVSRGLLMLADDRHRESYAGVLCTVDLRNDPVEVYESLLHFRPPEIDLLLPHGNWNSPPPSGVDDAETAYAEWLIAVFDRWFDAPRRETRIRFFESIIRLLLGGRSRTEAIGLSPIDLITVETDGTIEQSDTLKTAADGMAATGLDVWRHPFDAALSHPGLLARQSGLDGLADECRRCPIVEVCGGGLYAHRFRPENGFANPSVYCPDLYRLIGHVRQRLRAGLHELGRRQAPPDGPA